jgi:hypothetical protein
MSLILLAIEAVLLGSFQGAETGFAANPFLQHSGPGAGVVTVGTSTTGVTGDVTLELPVLPSPPLHLMLVWSVWLDVAPFPQQFPPFEDDVLLDGVPLTGVRIGSTPHGLQGQDQGATFVAFVPGAAGASGASFVVSGAGDRPIGVDPAAVGGAVALLAVYEMPGAPTRVARISLGMATTLSGDGQVEFSLPIDGLFSPSGLGLVLDAVDGRPETGTGEGAGSLRLEGADVSGQVNGLAGWGDAFAEPYTLLRDDLDSYGLVQEFPPTVLVSSERPTDGDDVAHTIAATFRAPAGSAWSVSAPGSPAAHGAPLDLMAGGDLQPGATPRLDVGLATPGEMLWFVAGYSGLGLPFKGGVMGPQPDIILGLPADAAGHVELSFTWPAFAPSGVSLFVQAWMNDTSGWASSRTLFAVTP